MTDAQLLARFLDGHEAAFEVLVDRHGPMVMRVCRGVLDDADDAHDAFQATFLVLVRRAGSIRKRDSLASWLFGVAGRISARARSDAARRRKHERRGASLMLEKKTEPARDLGDVIPIVHQEVARLPSAYREAVVLCDLQGHGYESAANVVGCPLGTFKARLSRARARLRDRLSRRGLDAMAVVPVARVNPAETIGLAKITARAASAYRSGRAAAVAAGVVSARVELLTEGMIGTMTLTKLTLISATTLALGLSAAGVALVAAPAGDGSKPAAGPLKPDEASGPQPVVLTVADAERHALAIAQAIPDIAERAEALLDLGEAQARRNELDAARKTLGLAVQAAEAIPPNSDYTIPHPIIRVAEAQFQAGDSDSSKRTFGKAVAVIEAEDQQHQMQNWANLVNPQLRAFGRISPETAAGYVRHESQAPFHSLDRLAPLRVRLQAATGDTLGALREAMEGAEFAGPEGAGRRRDALVGILSVMRADDPDALKVIETVKRWTNLDPPRPQRRFVNQDILEMASAEAHQGRFNDALAWARSLKTDNLPPHLVRGDRFNQAKTIIEIGQQQARAGDQGGALASAREALAIIDTFDDINYQTFPREQAGALMVEAGSLAAARQLAAILKADYRMRLLEKIAEAGRASGDVESARKDLKDALRAGQAWLDEVRKRPAPADGPDMRAQLGRSAESQVLRLQGRLGELDAARATIDAMADPTQRDEGYRVLAIARAGEGDLLAARELIGRIGDPQKRAKAWVSVACVLPAPAGAAPRR